MSFFEFSDVYDVKNIILPNIISWFKDLWMCCKKQGTKVPTAFKYISSLPGTKPGIKQDIHIYLFVFLFFCAWVCVCVRVDVCVIERETDWGNQVKPRNKYSLFLIGTKTRFPPHSSSHLIHHWEYRQMLRTTSNSEEACDMTICFALMIINFYIRLNLFYRIASRSFLFA